VIAKHPLANTHSSECWVHPNRNALAGNSVTDQAVIFLYAEGDTRESVPFCAIQ